MFKTARSANIHARPPIAQIIFMLTILGLEFDPNISLRSRSGFDFKSQFRRDGAFPLYHFIEHRTGDAYHFGKPSLRKSTRLQFISQQFTRMSGLKWLQIVGGISCSYCCRLFPVGCIHTKKPHTFELHREAWWVLTLQIYEISSQTLTFLYKIH